MSLIYFQIHDKDREFICPDCPEEKISVFSSRKQFRIHYKVHETEQRLKSLICQICSKTFSKSSKLRDHISTVHEKLMNYQCEICNKRFGRKENLRSHVILHGSKKFQCEYCDFTAKVKSYVVRHKRVCKNRKKIENIEVDATDRIFLMDSLPAAEEFELVEEDYKGFLGQEGNFLENPVNEENECYLQFAESIGFNSRSGGLDEHVCPLCDKAFNRPYNLVRHVISVHMNFKEAHTEIYCKYCCQILERTNFINHLIFRDYLCAVCSRKFLIKGHWARHEAKCGKRRTVQTRKICQICNLNCQSKEKLKIHMKEYHMKIEKYNSTNKLQLSLNNSNSYGLEDSSLTMKFFECDFCGQKCQLKSQINNHIQEEH